MTQAERPALLPQLKRLLSHSAVYGAADVFTNVTSLLLTPLFTRLMTRADYGALALLALFSSLAKIAFRLGLDSAYFRLHYDQKDEAARRRLAGTTALFAAGFATLLFALVVVFSGPLTWALFGDQPAPRRWLLLAAADIWIAALSFVPQALLRIQDRPRLFAGLSIVRHATNLVLKVGLLLGGFGVTGVLTSDLVATVVFTLALVPTLLRGASFELSWPMVRELLELGLPRVPHGLLLQVQNLADRRILAAFVSMSDVGLYSVGYTFGTAVKFALSAFEPAWQPFVYAQMTKPEGRQTLARLVTYVLSGFVFCALGVAVLGREVVRLMTAPSFHAAAPVVPVVALAYLLHGVFLLTSIGIGISKKARYYPIVTLASAGTNVAGNLLLIPRLGVMGAAWATVASYVVMAGLGLYISQRLHPIPFEVGRLLRVAAAAAVVYAASLWSPEAFVPAVAVKGALLLAFPMLVVATGALSAEERAWLRRRPWAGMSTTVNH